MHYDVVVVGGGSAGCVLAGRLSEDERRTVCLIEAGQDYGPHMDGRWPDDLLEPDGAMVDPDARFVGFDNLYVADASIMPTVPRANTHVTVLGIAEKVAETI